MQFLLPLQNKRSNKQRIKPIFSHFLMKLEQLGKLVVVGLNSCLVLQCLVVNSIVTTCALDTK